jgi:hypothetical protein
VKPYAWNREVGHPRPPFDDSQFTGHIFHRFGAVEDQVLEYLLQLYGSAVISGSPESSSVRIEREFRSALVKTPPGRKLRASLTA